jgi:hypothetical protein
VLYTVRSERMLMEQLEYNLLFRWFVGLNMDEPVTARAVGEAGEPPAMEAAAPPNLHPAGRCVGDEPSHGCRDRDA